MGNLKAKASPASEQRELIPAKRYKAVIIGVCDIGDQAFKNGSDRQIVIVWELHHLKKAGAVTDSKGRPHTISGFYTLKFGAFEGKKAKLRLLVEAMEGRTYTEAEAAEGIDVEELVGKSCEMQIQHEPNSKDKTKMRAVIGSILAIDPEDDKPESESDSFYYELDTAKDIPSDVPTWIHQYIKKSTQWRKVHGEPTDDRAKTATKAEKPLGGAAASDDDDDDEAGIPF